jgi:hypothetical protein
VLLLLLLLLLLLTHAAAVAAERESLLDEITRLVEQAGTSTELLNELILNKTEVRGVWSVCAAGWGEDAYYCC